MQVLMLDAGRIAEPAVEAAHAVHFMAEMVMAEEVMVDVEEVEDAEEEVGAEEGVVVAVVDS